MLRNKSALDDLLDLETVSNASVCRANTDESSWLISSQLMSCTAGQVYV